MAPTLFAELLDLLDLEEIDLNLYRGQNEQTAGERLFGGQVIAQALAAATRTVEERTTHSLHGYFLRPGEPSIPILYQVDRIRDGRSFTTRRVVAIQRGRAIFNLSTSFHKHETGFDHQLPMPDAPDPEELKPLPELLEANADRIPKRNRDRWPREVPLDLRYQRLPTYMGGPAFDGPELYWMRAPEPIGDDPLLHQCVMAYGSDFSLMDATVRPHSRAAVSMTASLDHSLWFHRPFRADEWLLFHQLAPSAAGARGFARAEIYTREGALVASAAQEGLIRLDASEKSSSP